MANDEYDNTQTDKEIFARLGSIAAEQASEAEQAGQTPTAHIVDLAQELATLNSEVNDLEEQLKRLKPRREQLRKVDIPDAMRSAGMVTGNKGSFTFDGGKIHLETRLYASAKLTEHDQFIGWLKSNGHGEIVKETWSAASVAAMIREMREEGVADPPHLEVYEETAAKISIRK